MAKILIVDDEENIREVVKEYCEIYGYEVCEAVDGVDALEKVQNMSFDCIVLDVMMPKLDGFSALKQIKEIDKSVPVIMLSARQEEYDKLMGFDLGVDDYVTKPFSPKELMARIKVAVSRRDTIAVTNDVYKKDGLEIDISGRKVIVDGVQAALTPKEIDLLIYMVKRPNVALSREQLLTSVWNYDYLGDARTVDTHIKMLRHNLGPYRDVIVTVRGMGYRFEA